MPSAGGHQNADLALSLHRLFTRWSKTSDVSVHADWAGMIQILAPSVTRLLDSTSDHLERTYALPALMRKAQALPVKAVYPMVDLTFAARCMIRASHVLSSLGQRVCAAQNTQRATFSADRLFGSLAASHLGRTDAAPRRGLYNGQVLGGESVRVLVALILWYILNFVPSKMLAALALLTLIPTIYAGKRGLDWTWYDGSLNPCEFVNSDGQVVAIYDYETYAPPATGFNCALGFIGMQRCYPTCDSSPIDQLQARQQAQGWATVFTINEADTNGVTPQEAAAWYIQYINPLAIKKALPSVTNSQNAGQGLSWVSQMISACAGQCYFDYINLHWYGTSFSQFQSYIEQAHNTFPNYQLVITEFALQNPPGGQADQINFFRQAFSFLDGASYVQLYFPFVATSPALLAANDAGAVSFVGTGSCLYNNDGSISAVGALLT